MGDKGSVAGAGVGTVVLNVIVQGKTRKIKLEKVHHAPTMGFNLMSVGMMEKRGAEVSFKGGKTIIKMNEKIAACGTRKSGLSHWTWPLCRILLRWPLCSYGMSALGTSMWLALCG